MSNVAVRLTDISPFISNSFTEVFENLLFLLFPKNCFDYFNFCPFLLSETPVSLCSK